mgnify:CR=1 FL=1
MNILPQFTEIKKEKLFEYEHTKKSQALLGLNIYRRKQFEVDLIDISKREFSPAIFYFLFFFFRIMHYSLLIPI